MADMPDTNAREAKSLAIAGFFGVATLFTNAMRRWMGDRQPGQKLPTFFQEIKHALKIIVLHLWNMYAARKAYGFASQRRRAEGDTLYASAAPPSDQDQWPPYTSQ